MCTKRWREVTPTLPGEPTRTPWNTPFFGYYSMGHTMSKARRERQAPKDIGGGIMVKRMRDIPARCATCHVPFGDERLFFPCAKPAHKIRPELTTWALDREILAEKLASETVAYLAEHGIVDVERGAIHAPR